MLWVRSRQPLCLLLLIPDFLRPPKRDVCGTRCRLLRGWRREASESRFAAQKTKSAVEQGGEWKHLSPTRVCPRPGSVPSIQGGCLCPGGCEGGTPESWGGPGREVGGGWRGLRARPGVGRGLQRLPGCEVRPRPVPGGTSSRSPRGRDQGRRCREDPSQREADSSSTTFCRGETHLALGLGLSGRQGPFQAAAGAAGPWIGGSLPPR